MIESTTVWTVTLALGLGTFLIRYSFLGLIGSRTLPPWALRHLRYVAVGVMPALVAPLVAWPKATGGDTDPARLTAALVALAVGAATRNLIATVAAGLATLYLVQAALPG